MKGPAKVTSIAVPRSCPRCGDLGVDAEHLRCCPICAALSAILDRKVARIKAAAARGTSSSTTVLKEVVLNA